MKLFRWKNAELFFAFDEFDFHHFDKLAFFFAWHRGNQGSLGRTCLSHRRSLQYGLAVVAFGFDRPDGGFLHPARRRPVSLRPDCGDEFPVRRLCHGRTPHHRHGDISQCYFDVLALARSVSMSFRCQQS